MSRHKNLGQFMPLDRLNKTPDNAKTESVKRPGRPERSPSRTPKRRKRELSPLTGQAFARRSLDSHARDGYVSPARLHTTTLSLSSPARRQTAPLNTSSMANRNAKASANTNANTNTNGTAPDVQVLERSPPSSPRSAKNRRAPKDRRTIANSDDDDDEFLELKAPQKAPVTSDFTIEIRDMPAKSEARPKKRIRDRMMDKIPWSKNSSQPRSNGVKRPIYSLLHGNDSVDELSKEYFHERAPKKANTAPVAAMESDDDEKAAKKPASSASKAAVSPFAQSIVQAPLRVVTAFRYPNHFLETDEADAACTMAVDPASPSVLRPTERAKAGRPSLFWLRVDLNKVNMVKHGDASCVVVLNGAIQEQHQKEGVLGGYMGLEFQTAEEARKMVAWASEPEYAGQIRIQTISDEKLQRTFGTGLSHAQGAAEKAALDRTRNGSTLARPVSVDGPGSAVRRAPEPLSILDDGVSSSPPSRRATRLRTSRGAQETVDLDGEAAEGDIFQCLEARRSTRTRSTRSSLLLDTFESPPPTRWTEENPDWAKDWKKPLTYSRTTVDKDDVARLDEGEFLNDNVINFYLQYLQDMLKKSNSTAGKRVYFHNTFFYEKLRPKKGRTISFDGVRRWTAKIDLFSYDYIVVPVNEHAHWWLAIMSNVPKFVADAMPEVEAEVEAEAKAETKAEAKAEVKEAIEVVDACADGAKSERPSTMDGERPSGPVSSPGSPKVHKAVIDVDAVKAEVAGKKTPPAIRLHDSDDDEVTEIKSDIIATPTTASPVRKLPKAQVKKLFVKNTKRRDPKDPRIITLDSLGSPHSVSIDHLKQWLLAEIGDRKGVKPADPGALGMTAKTIPQQENYCDCGVYLLLYLQEFVRDPDAFIEDIVQRNERRWTTSAPDMRKQLRDLILHLQKTQEADKGKKSPRERGDCGSAASTAKGQDRPDDRPRSKPVETVHGNGEATEAEAGREGSSASSSIGPAEAGMTSPFEENSPDVFGPKPQPQEP